MRKSIYILCLMLCTISCKAGSPKRYNIEVVKEYNHDTGAYTQGLFFSGGQLYESTGQFGESTMRIVDLQTGRVQRKLDFSRKYFAEGSVILGDKLYILRSYHNVNRLVFTKALIYAGKLSTKDFNKFIPYHGRTDYVAVSDAVEVHLLSDFYGSLTAIYQLFLIVKLHLVNAEYPYVVVIKDGPVCAH